MPKFGQRSRANLATCQEDLRTLFSEVIRWWDCTILCGARPQEEQDAAFYSGRSKVKFPNSKHNVGPGAPRELSAAADVMPYPIDWHDHDRIVQFAGFVKGVAAVLLDEGTISHRITWGGDWDSDGSTKDHTFFDGPHFQLEEADND